MGNYRSKFTGPQIDELLSAVQQIVYPGPSEPGYSFGGIATPSTDPGFIDPKLVYLASEPGIYTAFNNIEVKVGELVALVKESLGTWVKIPLTKLNSYYTTCTSSGNTPDKIVELPSFSLNQSIRVLIKMVSKNTSSNATLNINNTGARPLYYKGLPVSSTNTWNNNELLDIYYDGTSYQVIDNGSSSFGSGQNLNQVNIVNNLDSDNENDVLSAKQGKALKGFIDGNYEELMEKINQLNEFTSQISFNNNNNTLTLGSKVYILTEAQDHYRIITESDPVNGGTITGGDSYQYGDVVTLKATPAIGYEFTRWSTGETSPQITITVLGTATYTAYFTKLRYTVSTAVTPNGSGTVIGGGTYDYGTQVTLTPQPTSEYRFVKWNDGNTDNPRDITVTENVTYTATFAINRFTITTVSDPADGGSVTGGGEFNLNQSTTLTATPNAGYSFNKWVEDDSVTNPRTITVTGNATYTAQFIANSYTVTATADPNEGGTVSGGGSYTYNQRCTLTATPADHYRFDHWDNDVTATNPTLSFDVTQNVSHVAHFALINYTITVESDNTSQGTVSGSGSFAYGATTQISASRVTGYEFDHWNDNNTTNPRTITVTGNATYTAYFRIKNIVVNASSNNTSWGTVTGGNTYQEGSSVTLNATPATGYHFVNWTLEGTQVSTSANYTFSATADGAYVANFAINNYTINASSNNSSWGTVTGGGSHNYDSTATLVATPLTGYRFINWTENGAAVSTNATYSFTVNADRTLVANFEFDYTQPADYYIGYLQKPDGMTNAEFNTYFTNMTGNDLITNSSAVSGYKILDPVYEGTASQHINPEGTTTIVLVAWKSGSAPVGGRRDPNGSPDAFSTVWSATDFTNGLILGATSTKTINGTTYTIAGDYGSFVGSTKWTVNFVNQQ